MSDEVVVRVADAEVIRGQDGFSPIFSSEAIPGGHLVRVEDVNGPHEFNVLDGERGKTGATGAKGDKGDPGNYTKPDSGIPKTDLSSAVQASLDKADTAIQLGLTGASVGDLVRVAAVDANGKPTSWKHVPLCEIKTNPNLLDNWYFVGGGSQRTDVSCAFPINQRGLTSYQNAGYCIDRWLMTGSVSVSSDSINVIGAIYQKLENLSALYGKTLTFSAITRLGLFYTGTAVLASSGDTVFFEDDAVSLKYDDTLKGFKFSAQNYNPAALKLELGSKQTLAHQESGAWVLNEIPDYYTELQQCRYYFRVLESKPGVGTSQYFTAIRGYNDATYLSVPVEPPMAKNIVPSLPDGIQGSAIDGAGTAANLSSVEASGSYRRFGIRLDANLDRTPIVVYLNRRIYLSAEL